MDISKLVFGTFYFVNVLKYQYILKQRDKKVYYIT